jgi:protein gp37
MTRRLKAMEQPNYFNGFKIALHEHALKLPLQWKKPQTIFVNSMSDIFHKDVPLRFINKIFSVMKEAHWHTFQILTKRAERLSEIHAKLNWSPNIWIGVSVENNDFKFRIDCLRKINAKIKFLSLEPLLGPLNHLDLKGIDWVIVGGESGPGTRPMDASWVIDIRNQCLKAKIPFFFKQWGGFNKKKTGRLLEGKTWDEMPRLKDLVSEDACCYQTDNYSE